MVRRAGKRRDGNRPRRLRNLPHLRRLSLPTEVPSVVSAGLTYFASNPGNLVASRKQCGNARNN